MQLAQLNLAKARADLDDPIMKGFVDRIPATNALADRSPGFVWRLQDESGDATYLRPFPDADLLVNLSVWDDVEAFRGFVYDSPHVNVVKMRHDWFLPGTTEIVCWWIEDGDYPDLDQAKARLEHLRTHGPTPYAFTLKQTLPPQVGAPIAGAVTDSKASPNASATNEDASQVGCN